MANQGVKSRLKQKIMAKAESEEKLVSKLPKSISAKLGLKSKASDASAPVASSSTTAETPNISTSAGADAGKEEPKSVSEPPSTQGAIKGEPRVLHGHTLTKGASFREIAYAIRDSAFKTSDLPVIISFEVHANLEQQQLMVDIIHEAWKGLLVEVPADTPTEKLPTLAQLKGKILIKTKSLPLKGTKEIDEETKGEESETEELEDKSASQNPKPVKPVKILEALAKLAIYTRAYHFSHFDQPGKHWHFNVRLREILNW